MLLLAACQASVGPSLAPPEPLPISEDRYSGLAWLDDGTLVSTVTRDGPRGTSFQLVLIDGDEVEFRALQPVESCPREGIRTLSTLPDGRLGFTLDCDGVDSGLTQASVRALDLATGASEELAALPSRGLGGYTFAPGLDRGLVAESARICATIAAIVDGQVIPSDIVVEDGGHTFGISDQFRDRPDQCTEYGNADLPAWAPDGSQIAFFATGGVVGRSGGERLGARWNLYLVETDGTDAEPALGEITAPYKLAWSRDSQHLAFTADEYNGRSGTWVFTPETGEVRQVADELMFQLSWSPEGDQLAGIAESELDGPSHIVTIPTGFAD